MDICMGVRVGVGRHSLRFRYRNRFRCSYGTIVSITNKYSCSCKYIQHIVHRQKYGFQY